MLEMKKQCRISEMIRTQAAQPKRTRKKLVFLVIICILGMTKNLVQEIKILTPLLIEENILTPLSKENVDMKRNNLAPHIQQSSLSVAHTFINETILGACKPMLIEHIGPKKTGTTQLQLGIFYNKKWAKTLWSDYLEVFNGGNYRTVGKFVKNCLSVTHQNRRDCTIWKQVEAAYERAFLKAQESNCQVRMVHSLETFTNQHFINSDIKLLLRSLWKEWDTTVVLYYRRFDEWLISMYAQVRKYGFMNVRGFYKHYNVRKDLHIPFPVFVTKLVEDTPVVADILGIHGVYTDILSSKNNDTAEGEVNRGGRIGTIRVLQFHSIHGIEQEFLCNLPNATKSCEQIQNTNASEKKNGPSKVNSSAGLPLDLDFVVVQAWNDGLVGIDRHQAQKLLATKMATANITFTDLPQECISKVHEDWIWERALRSEIAFGNPPVPEIELRHSFDITSKKFCSVDAVAALQNNLFRSLFDDCGFFGTDTTLGINWSNYLKLKELGCA